ncbi:MAG: preprotein translocase subunit YajC [Firmicutes bacterium]|nr:preprotein translocase subunit YajC [Bacillota bacterium]
MLNLLGNQELIDSLVFIGIIAAAFIGLLFLTTVRRKTQEKKQVAFIDTLRPGMEVFTYGGIYGKIKEIREVGVGKEVLLECGSDKYWGYLRIDINAVMDLDRRLELAQREREAKEAKETSVSGITVSKKTGNTQEATQSEVEKQESDRVKKEVYKNK